MLRKSDYPVLLFEYPQLNEFIDHWNKITIKGESQRTQLLFWFPIVSVVTFISFEILLGVITGWENFACHGQQFGRGWLCWGD